MIIRNGKAILTDRLLGDAAVSIDEATGQIEAVGLASDMRQPHPGETVFDAGGATLAPGFIDLHCHGAWGADFMDAAPGDFGRITAFHALYGVTSLLATSASSGIDALLEMLKTTSAILNRGTPGSEVLGAHLEGPWLNEVRKGCHLGSQVRPPGDAERRALLEHAATIRMMTLSPELPGGLDVTRQLRSLGITVSTGHSDMFYDGMMEAIEAGVSHVTHIFCAMSTVVRKGPYRIPGVLETTLADDRLTTEMIADGKHLPPALMKIAYRCKGADRLALVSDAMRGAGMPPGGHYTFGPRDGTEVVVDDGVAMLPDRSAFASSTTPLGSMVRNAIQLVGIPLVEAVRMASLTPARIAGVADRKGSLEAGKDADLCILDADFQVKETIVRGRLLDRQKLQSYAP